VLYRTETHAAAEAEALLDCSSAGQGGRTISTERGRSAGPFLLFAFAFATGADAGG